MLRIGHKGADALVPGNTIASFVKAVEVGVDAIEFDVLWTEDGHPSIDPGKRSELVVAHDWHAAAAAERKGGKLTLETALEAFKQPPLDRVRINLDIKLPGRDDEVFDAVVRHRLVERTSVSTMEVSTLRRLGELKREDLIESGMSLGWTVPKVTRDWLSMPKVIRPALAMGLVSVRVRMPGQVRRGLQELEVDSIWAFFGVVTPRLVETIHDAGKKLNVWTVDDPDRIDSLTAMGVDGICSNDPRLLYTRMLGV
ncbi:MAG: glycerophosphodiester phosphodiesterase [Solirubrobacterales bacterium]|nr:glycerophosphodiester phosphodiesterase [Solirubrobacterales bacterium]MCB0859191.1 glycerophosphodiester phosphodiesterase [Solirubrobacterales bacterium]HRV59091.1 glycerophosphodiester phosphodiesterase [Solirubrobacterales bacterium]